MQCIFLVFSGTKFGLNEFMDKSVTLALYISQNEIVIDIITEERTQ